VKIRLEEPAGRAWGNWKKIDRGKEVSSGSEGDRKGGKVMKKAS